MVARLEVEEEAAVGRLLQLVAFVERAVPLSPKSRHP
jgi:hypothetical protein